MPINSYRLLRQCRMAALLVFIGQSSFLFAQQVSRPMAGSTDEPKSDALFAKSLFALPGTEMAAVSHESLPSAPLPSELRQPLSSSAIAPAMIIATPAPPEQATHAFWDLENRTLFALNGTLAAADFFTTHRNLDQNGKELNPVARAFTGSTPALATNFALETGGVVGISYLFHKTGHHKLERMTSYVNLGGSAFAIGYNLCHN